MGNASSATGAHGPGHGRAGSHGGGPASQQPQGPPASIQPRSEGDLVATTAAVLPSPFARQSADAAMFARRSDPLGGGSVRAGRVFAAVPDPSQHPMVLSACAAKPQLLTHRLFTSDDTLW